MIDNNKHREFYYKVNNTLIVFRCNNQIFVHLPTFSSAIMYTDRHRAHRDIGDTLQIGQDDQFTMIPTLMI